VLDHETHTLTVSDAFEGAGVHRVSIPLHLTPGVEASRTNSSGIRLSARGKEFQIRWSPEANWEVAIMAGRVSPSYGIAHTCTRLVWRAVRDELTPLTIEIAPVCSRDDVDQATRTRTA
jgi:hypothetical protein